MVATGDRLAKTRRPTVMRYWNGRSTSRIKYVAQCRATIVHSLVEAGPRREIFGEIGVPRCFRACATSCGHHDQRSSYFKLEVVDDEELDVCDPWSIGYQRIFGYRPVPRRGMLGDG